ncbi:gliding motility lipoprotein GldD [Algibacter miyuki]|uniref:Gliding motility lipoprotein GldD n=1 Tax=Algibacter miyuki TaxID=1306933 RepID=A0ABV5GWD1_9FLAO|nr:gliding motility lipoprotein GldD [Algibacter miyuki]MDN3665271.1 gliding motility lipoprotein GldD [Algibacter miyuki]
MTLKRFYVLLLLAVCFSCQEDFIPKPKAFLRLEYPTPKYSASHLEPLPFTFETNALAAPITLKLLHAPTQTYGLNIDYPTLNGTVFLTYKAVNENNTNLENFIQDAQKLTLEHTKKADEIPAYPYENAERKVYGLFSEVIGNVASPAQFYITDSINHFLTASLYFNTKPNYDSILPAANYLQNDMKHIMETIKWKE